MESRKTARKFGLAWLINVPSSEVAPLYGYLREKKKSPQLLSQQQPNFGFYIAFQAVQFFRAGHYSKKYFLIGGKPFIGSVGIFRR